MKLTFKRGQKGFTLVELMVVVGILAVLMSVVFPAVTGTKSTSMVGQVQSDAASVQKALDNFQNKGVSPLYPEQALGTKTAYKLPAGTILTKKELDLAGDPVTITVAADAGVPGSDNALGTQTDYTLGANAAPTYKELNWDATTRVWQSDGSVNTAYFVPDFLLKEPSSVPLDNDESVVSFTNGTYLAEFLWLVKVNNPGSQDASRTLEVYRLQDWTSGAATYKQIF